MSWLRHDLPMIFASQERRLFGPLGANLKAWADGAKGGNSLEELMAGAVAVVVGYECSWNHLERLSLTITI